MLFSPCLYTSFINQPLQIDTIRNNHFATFTYFGLSPHKCFIFLKDRISSRLLLQSDKECCYLALYQDVRKFGFLRFLSRNTQKSLTLELTQFFSLQKSPLVSAPSPNLTPIPQLRGSRGQTPRSSSPPVLPHGLPRSQNWSAVCLRPTAPLRPCLALGAAPGGPYQRYNSRRATTYKEDGQILDVIEAYCTLGKPRCTLTSGKCFWRKYIRFSRKSLLGGSS